LTVVEFRLLLLTRHSFRNGASHLTDERSSQRLRQRGPVAKSSNTFVCGGGAGLKLGVGWEFRSEFTPRITYSLAREETLETARGATVARGWTHRVLLLELGVRGM